MFLICQCQLLFDPVPPFFGVVGIPLAIGHTQLLWCVFFAGVDFSTKVFVGEFDPGSGRTLAACLTHASRAERPFRGYSSGERVSNT